MPSHPSVFMCVGHVDWLAKWKSQDRANVSTVAFDGLAAGECYLRDSSLLTLNTVVTR